MSKPSRFSTLASLCLLLGGSLGLSACPPDESDDDDVVAPPGTDDDDAPDCDGDYDCNFTSGLEICSDDGFCIEGDRNNSREEAQLLEMNSTATLPLAPAGDIDWFRFSGSAGDLVLLAASADDTDKVDTVIVFTDADGNEIAYNDDFDRVSDIAPDSRLYTGLSETGVWYFSVQDRRSWVNDPRNPAEGGAEHTYTASVVEANPDSYITVATGQDDSAEDAVAWDVVETYTNYTCGGMLEPTGDEDWFAVPVVESEALRLYGFPNSGSAGSVQVEVYLPDGETLVGTWQDLTWETEHRAWMPVLETGDYYLRVTEAEGLGGFDYWYYLHAAKNPAKEGQPSEVEPNDDASQAVALAVGTQTVWSRIFPAADEDWYSIDAEDGDQLTVTFARISGDEDTALAIDLMDPTGTITQSLTWDGEEDPVLSLEVLDQVGVWNLVIREQDPTAGATADRYYQLDVGLVRL